MLGTLIKNRYKLLKKIGGGGMAEVYKAIDLTINHEVAIKILHHQYVYDNDFVKRFRREAQSVASLSHQNVVSIYDIGEEQEIYFIVMEYVEGMTLKELIREKGVLPVDEALEIAKKIASALDHAHQHNIVHRDIKPHNILIGNNGEVKVTDFGIARAASQATITHTGSVMGSVHYLSPEQARGGWTDEKTDIYSLGIVLYEMVTGSLPFSGDSPITVALKHLQETFVYPREINSEIPQSVENIIIKALAKEPSKRYSSASEMLQDLETALEPERLNEPQYIIETEELTDEERTMILPSLSEIGIESKYSYQNKSRKTKNKGFIRKILVAFAFIVFITISFYGIQYIKGKLIVPELEMPIVEGKHQSEAITELEKYNLQYRIIERYDPVVKEGYVIKQNPYQGSMIKANQTVDLYVSMGKEKIAVPDVIGHQQKQAKTILGQQGFNNVEIIPAFDEEAAIGTIFRQEPTANEKVIPDETKVILFVSKGKENFSMPDLIGKTEDEAKAILLTNGLVEGKIEHDYSFEQPEGRVFRQFPFEPGREVTAGDKVDLSISKGYPEDAKTIYGEVIVLVDDGEETEITIVVRDSREKDIIHKKETITSSRFYREIGLILTPDDHGTITVYKNGKLYYSTTVEYY